MVKYCVGFGLAIFRSWLFANCEISLANTIWTDGDYTWVELSGGEVAVSGYTGAGGDIAIPATLGGKTVTQIGEYAFMDNTTITGVTMPDTLTKIDFQAFDHYTSLSSITLSSALDTIEASRFRGDVQTRKKIFIPFLNKIAVFVEIQGILSYTGYDIYKKH